MDITWREWVEQLVATERNAREIADQNERLLRESSAASAARALELQTEELARRLEILNGERAREQELRGSMMLRETHETFVRSHNEAERRQRELDDAWRSDIKTRLDEQRGANARTMLIITVGLTALSIALRFWG